MKKAFFEYFHYTQKERNGVIILAIFCVIINYLPELVLLFYTPTPSDFSAFQAEISQWENTIPAAPKDTLFLFDPNTATKEELLALGIPARTVGTLINFRSKGGKFYQNEDLKKVYGLSETLFEKLEPFITIERKQVQKNWEKPKSKTYSAPAYAKKNFDKDLKVDINQADAAEWKKLRGIGPVLSGRIVKFRDKLGGFSSIEQVAETYGLADSTFQDIKEQLTFSPVFNPININQADPAALQAHPYLNWRQAKAIVNYREMHGPFKGEEDLKKLEVISDNLLSKLIPYLTFK